MNVNSERDAEEGRKAREEEGKGQVFLLKSTGRFWVTFGGSLEEHWLR